MDASAQAAPFKVPFPRPDLIGREQDVERLHALLQQGRTAAVTPALTGQGGIGKTQLAVLYAHDKAGAYPGGVFWLDAAKDARPVAEQLGGYALEMGLAQPSAAGDTQEYYRQLALVWCGLAGSRSDALLIADNVEDGAFLAGEMPGLPGKRLAGLGCRRLVTSRETDLPNCTEVKVDFLHPPRTGRCCSAKPVGRKAPMTVPRWTTSSAGWAACRSHCASPAATSSSSGM